MLFQSIVDPRVFAPGAEDAGKVAPLTVSLAHADGTLENLDGYLIQALVLSVRRLAESAIEDGWDVAESVLHRACIVGAKLPARQVVGSAINFGRVSRGPTVVRSGSAGTV